MTKGGWICVLVAAGLMLGGTPAVEALPRQAGEVAATVPAPSRERERMNRRVFERVWSEVRRGYYDPRLHGVDWNAARTEFRPQALAATGDRELYRVLNRMLDKLDDDHAGVIPPASARRQDARQDRRAVIGLTMQAEEDREDVYRIERVLPGSPAAEAGVELGWLLDGSGTDAWSPDVSLSEGRDVVLRLIDDDDQPRVITLRPRVMDPRPIFVSDRSRENVLVLSVDGFEPGLSIWMADQLRGLAPEVSVVLDLRGNPGGRLLEAEAVLSCFVPGDRPWATRTSRSGRAHVMRIGDQPCGDLGRPIDNPLAVIVDEGSRSAAELTPAALQEAGRARVVGERTGGAVLISREIDLPDGGRMTLSLADFVTAAGVRLEKRGVEPDLAAETTVSDRREGRDPALDAAISAITVQAGAAEAL